MKSEKGKPTVKNKKIGDNFSGLDFCFYCLTYFDFKGFSLHDSLFTFHVNKLCN